MATGVELRPIKFAWQFNKLIERIIELLNSYHPSSMADLKSKSLCYHRDGKLDICESPCKNSLLDWCLMAFYDYFEFSDKHIFSMGLNYKKVISFANALVCESPYDEELLDKYHRSVSDIQNFNLDFNSITDEAVDKIAEEDLWWSRYAEYRQRVTTLADSVGYELGWSDTFRGVFKDRILSKIFYIDDYLPERLSCYKKGCEETMTDLLKEGGLDAMSEYRKRLLNKTDSYFREFFYSRENLFTEVEINDLKLYMIAVNINFETWTY